MSKGMSICRHCHVRIIRFLDHWEHVSADGTSVYIHCRTATAGPTVDVEEGLVDADEVSGNRHDPPPGTFGGSGILTGQVPVPTEETS